MNLDSSMHIVLPLIEESNARAAFPVARRMANIFAASLRVMAGGTQAPTGQDLARRLSVAPEDLAGVAIEAAAGDFVAATIARCSALRQALLVLAVRLRGDVEIMGHRMLEKIQGPILIVPPEQDMSGWQLRRELLPQNGTPSCAAALAQLIKLSSQRGVENLVLRVAGAKVGQPTEPGSLATPRYVDHPQHEWTAWSQEFLDRICGMDANLNPVGLRLRVATGEPAAEILRVAQEEAIDMIILPWHGALGSGRACMIKAVLSGARCPVLLLPSLSSRG